MAQTIQLRRGTAALWTAVNPTLNQGEAGLELDTNKLKFGDGATAWIALPYFSAGSAYTLNPVATNAAKLALVGIAPGYQAQITGEGNRVEQYIGGAITSDANWLIIGNNTVHLYLDASYNDINTLGSGVAGSITINEVDVSKPNSGVIDLGWADPLRIPVSGTDQNGPFSQAGGSGWNILPNGVVPGFGGSVLIGTPETQGYGSPLLMGGLVNENNGTDACTGFAVLPVPAAPRGTVVFVL